MTENIQFLSTINKKKTSNSTTQHKIFQTHQPNLKKKPSPPKETTNYPYPRYPRRSPFFTVATSLDTSSFVQAFLPIVLRIIEALSLFGDGIIGNLLRFRPFDGGAFDARPPVPINPRPLSSKGAQCFFCVFFGSF